MEMGVEAGTGPVKVVRVTNKKGLRLFVELPYRIHGLQPMFVPMPRHDVYTLLNRKKHPFHEHAEVDYFLAFRNRKCVGRIAAIENHAHNQFHEENIGFFGFLDAMPEQEVFDALLARVEEWAKERGLDAVRGPASFSTNEECGLLVDNFESPPLLMTPWNPESYPGLVEGSGYRKAMDLYSYWSTTNNYNPRMERIAKLVEDRMAKKGETITVRSLDKSRWDEEIQLARHIYNAAWEKNWGFVPMTQAEFEFMAKQLKPLADPRLIIFMEVNGEPAAFSLTVPDFNVALRHMEGKLGPKQILLFLLLRKQIKQVRVMAMGVVEKFRNRGLESMLVRETVNACITSGYRGSELGWILETNLMMNREMTASGAKRYKTHRFYEKPLKGRGPEGKS